MRSKRHNLTVDPQEYYPANKLRRLLSIRNLHATETILVQGGAGQKRDMYPILAGDVLTLENADVQDAIWLCSDTVAHDDCVILVA